MAELSSALERMSGLYAELIQKGEKSIYEVPYKLRPRVEELQINAS